MIGFLRGELQLILALLAEKEVQGDPAALRSARIPGISQARMK